ncbi:MAG: TPM domain-containing protein [Flavisolibacter sp.]
MKKLALVISLLFSVCAFAQIENIAPKRPNPPRLVNDSANVLTPDQAEALEKKLVAYDDSTSNQIAIVLLPTITDSKGVEYPIEDVSLKILRDWGVGSKKNNNGIVILAAMQEHKLRIEVGYGLEGAIPDMIAKSIIETDLRPAFKDQNYYRGLDDAINSIIKAAAGEYKAPEGYGDRGVQGRPGLGKIIFGIIIFIIIMSIFGGRGGGGGGYMSRRGSGWLGPFILGSMLGRGGGGFGGGGWSGGGGGGFGGGGFGGFGGGGGGGGGASGGW